MIQMFKADSAHIETLAHLGRVTYTESHGDFIENKDDLHAYNASAFSPSTLLDEMNEPNNQFYLLYKNEQPIGYAKLVVEATYEKVNSNQCCKLERIYILDAFIPLKLGASFYTFLEQEAAAIGLDTMWLCVYVGNKRALRFYEKMGFERVGETLFYVNKKGYENYVLSKTIP